MNIRKPKLQGEEKLVLKEGKSSVRASFTRKYEEEVAEM